MSISQGNAPNSPFNPDSLAYFAYVQEMFQTKQYLELLKAEGNILASDDFKRNAFGSYQPTASDIIVSTYPKSGASWAMQIAQEIAWLGKAEFDYIHDVIPWPDKAIGTPVVPLSDTSMAERSPTGYRVIKSHLEAEYVPYNKHAKYIIVTRDPKEVVVSGFHFENGFYEKMVGSVVPLSAYVKGFLTGNYMYDSWAVHTASWWALKENKNVLHLFYHEMKAEPTRAINKIANFMSIELSRYQFLKVAEKSSYDYRKAHNSKFSLPTPPDYPVQGNVETVRSGESGKAKDELTVVQQEQIDTFCIAELKRFGSDFPYKHVVSERLVIQPARNLEWSSYDPTWLVDLATEQVPEKPWLADALAKCTLAAKSSEAYIYFVDPTNANQPDAEWQFKTNISSITCPTEGWIILDILTGNRIGGIEFYAKLIKGPPMKFYFDYISPYAYIGWKQIHALADKYKRSVTPIPILFGALLNESGRLGPAETPLMRRWVGKNIQRKCNELGIPLAAPATHPFNPLLALRATALDMTTEQRHKLIDLLFEATWATGQDVTDPGVVGSLLTKVGLDADHGLAQVQQEQIKQRIKLNTTQAIEAGTFGVPTIVVDDELFWGHDDFHFLDKFLSGEESYSQESMAAWENVKASIQRKR